MRKTDYGISKLELFFLITTFHSDERKNIEKGFIRNLLDGIFPSL